MVGVIALIGDRDVGFEAVDLSIGAQNCPRIGFQN